MKNVRLYNFVSGILDCVALSIAAVALITITIGENLLH